MAGTEIIKILKEYVILLRSEGINIDDAYLYGSYLSDSFNEESDIDILLVSENEDDYIAGKVWSLTRKVNSRIEPYLVKRERFEDNTESPLIDLVKKTGLKIA